jgi:hypothetical protein
MLISASSERAEALSVYHSNSASLHLHQKRGREPKLRITRIEEGPPSAAINKGFHSMMYLVMSVPYFDAKARARAAANYPTDTGGLLPPQ